jgi:hypothetical protein
VEENHQPRRLPSPGRSPTDSVIKQNLCIQRRLRPIYKDGATRLPRELNIPTINPATDHVRPGYSE